MPNISKEAAVFLGTSGIKNPTQDEWKKAIQVVAAKKGKSLDGQEFGKAVMEAQFDFQDGISDEWLAREQHNQLKEGKDAKDVFGTTS